MKITTWNVNGVRAREAQVLDWVKTEQPDVLCLQEIKASPSDVPEALCSLDGYWCYWHGHKGYSGVALNLSRAFFPDRPKFSHPQFDHENRIVTAEIGSGPGALVLASVYVPNGGKDFPAKMRFLEAMDAFAQDVHGRGQQLILCGDLNVAREERDVHPKLRKPEQIGQTPEERALLERIISRGLVDLSRKFEPDNDQLFSWWAPWRQMRERNIGWRLDYVLASSELAEKSSRCAVFREFGTSDHGPVAATFAVEPFQSTAAPETASEQQGTAPPQGQALGKSEEPKPPQLSLDLGPARQG